MPDDVLCGPGSTKPIILKNNTETEGSSKKSQKLGHIIGQNQNTYKNISVKSQGCQTQWLLYQKAIDIVFLAAPEVKPMYLIKYKVNVYESGSFLILFNMDI